MRALAALALGVLASAGALAQPLDSLATAGPVVSDSASTRTARGAVTRSLLVPGLGQVYNRQPLKAPIAAALVLGSVVFAADRQRQYVRFRRATVFAGCTQDVVPDDRDVFAEVCAQDAPGYEDEWMALGSPAFGAVRPIRDRARGQRDIGVLVVAVAYAFQALDAYVAAELADFDVSEDVTVGLERESAGLRVTVRL